MFTFWTGGHVNRLVEGAIPGICDEFSEGASSDEQALLLCTYAELFELKKRCSFVFSC